MKTKLKNTIRFRVSLFKNDEGTIWEQEFIKPILNYRKYTTVLKNSVMTEEVHPYPISPYDLFDDEVIKTVETYSVESGLTKKECINLFKTSGNGTISINLGNDEYDETSEDYFYNSGCYPYYERGNECWDEVIASLRKSFDECKERVKENIKEVVEC